LVGTELGSYSTAVTAGEERQKDRNSMWGGGGEDESFELAARMGKQDGSAFSFGGDAYKPAASLEKSFPSQNETKEDDNIVEEHTIPAPEVPQPTYLQSLEASNPMVPYDGSADAWTVGYTEDNEYGLSSSSSIDLQSVYQSIRENKSKEPVELGEGGDEERPDPGFHIYHVDERTGEHREVPPHTAPGAFLESIKQDSGSDDTTTIPLAPKANASRGQNNFLSCRFGLQRHT
jgi:hypothetical protein